MNYSELYDFYYLFHYVLNFKNKLLLKIDGKLATATPIHLNDDSPTELKTNFKLNELEKIGYYTNNERLNNLNALFKHEYPNNPFNGCEPLWKSNPSLSIIILKQFINHKETTPFDNEQLLYDVKFEGSNEQYACYLINQKTKFEVVGIIE